MTDRTDSDLDLDVIRARADAATPGPWRRHDTHLPHGGYTATVLSGEGNATDLIAWLPTWSEEPWDTRRNCWNDAEFVAAARTDVPALLAEVERLQEAVVAVDAIRHAIADPGAWVRRVFDPEGEPRESVSAWSARAVVALLTGEARRA